MSDTEIKLEPSIQPALDGLLKIETKSADQATHISGLMADVAIVSAAISAKRQADAMEQIAHSLGEIAMMLHSRG